MFSRTILMLILLWKQDTVKSVRLTELRVPTHGPEGGRALLSCQYDMENDTLYSVKWYKDGQEFYRYIPKNEPPMYVFSTPGVNVDLTSSSSTLVTLLNLTQDSAGQYKCEVSGEAPLFITASKQKYINVQLVPRSRPRVTGLHKQYSIDDFVIANCSLPPSRPKAALNWLVNNQPAPRDYIQGPWYRVSAERPDAAETILQLSFKAAARHFVNGAINIKCQATIAPIYQMDTESTHYIALPLTMPNGAAEHTNALAANMGSILISIALPIIYVLALI